MDSTEVSSDLHWQKPEFPGLPERLENAFLEVASEVGSFEGRLEWEGPPTITKRAESRADFDRLLATGDPPTRLSIWLRSREGDYRASIDGDLARHRLHVSLEVPDADADKAKAALVVLQEALGLGARPRKHARRSLELTYQAPQDVSLGWLRLAIEVLEGQVSDANHFDGSYHTIQGGHYEVGDREPWLEMVEAKWDDLDSLRCWLNGPTRHVSLWLSFRACQLRLQVGAPSSDDAESCLERIARDLQLAPWEADAQLEGERRHFFAPHFDEAWFDRAVSLLRRHAPRPSHFIGQFRKSSRPGRESERDSVETWSTDVRAHWPEIARSRCYLDSPRRRIEMVFDHLRHHVELRVMAPTHKAAADLNAEIAATLGLEPASGSEYEARSSGVYRIDGWTADRFADAIEKAVANYVAERPLLDEAAVVEGDDEPRSRRTFSELGELLDAVRRSDHIAAVHLVAFGPRGAGLAIHMVDKPPRELDIRSSLPAKEFRELVKFFKPLGLSEPTEEPSNGQRASQRFVDTTVGKVVMMAAGLVLGASVWEYLRPIIPRYELIITSPRGTEEHPLELPNGSTVRVEWVLQKEQWTTKSYVEPEPTNVRILRAGGTELDRRERQLPGWEVELPPGDYVIEVTSTDRKLRSTSEVSIAEPEATEE